MKKLQGGVRDLRSLGEVKEVEEEEDEKIVERKRFRQPERRLTEDPDHLNAWGPLDLFKSRTYELESPLEVKH